MKTNDLADWFFVNQRFLSLITGYLVFMIAYYFLIQWGFIFTYGEILSGHWWGLTMQFWILNFLMPPCFFIPYFIQFFVSLIPLLLIFFFNIWWFNRIFVMKPMALKQFLLMCVFGIVLAFSFLLTIAVLFSMNASLWISFFNPFNPATDWLSIFPLLFIVLFLYLLLITTVSVKNPTEFMTRVLTSLKFWISYFVISALFSFSFFVLCDNLLSESLDQLIVSFTTLLFTSLPVAIILPSFLLIFIYFGSVTTKD